MSIPLLTSLIEEQKPYGCAESLPSGSRISNTSSARDLFTHQTGQILSGIGSLFVNVPPFNDHIDRNIGNLLISLGRKLKAGK